MKDYKKLKAAGVIKLVATGQGVIAQRSKWDPNTGLPVMPELMAVDEAALTAEKTALGASVAARVADIDELLADADQAKKKVKP